MTPYARWCAVRERAFTAHVAAADEDARTAAVADLLLGMQELRLALDADDAAVFDGMLRRDYETLLLAEASIRGAVCEATLRRVAQREIAAGRMSAGDAFAHGVAARRAGATTVASRSQHDAA